MRCSTSRVSIHAAKSIHQLLPQRYGRSLAVVERWPGNRGLGIARIRGFRVLFDGRKMNIDLMTDALSPFGFVTTKVKYAILMLD